MPVTVGGPAAVIVCRVDHTVAVDADGRIRRADPGVTELLGYDAGDAVNHDVWEVVHPTDLPRAKSWLANLHAGASDQPTLSVRCHHDDGTWRWCEVLAQLLGDGRVLLGLRWVSEPLPATDMPTSRSLRQRASIESRYDILYLASADGIVLSIEEEPLRKLFGWEPHDVVGHAVWEFVHPDDLAAAAEAFTDELAFVDYRGTSKVLRILRGDGGWRRCETHGWNRLADPDLRGIVIGLRYIRPDGTLVPGRVPPEAWSQLTRAEQDIATAVSCGLSNKQIASNAHKSIRTVESQLATIYRKLDIRSRGELIAEVMARQ